MTVLTQNSQQLHQLWMAYINKHGVWTRSCQSLDKWNCNHILQIYIATLENRVPGTNLLVSILSCQKGFQNDSQMEVWIWLTDNWRERVEMNVYFKQLNSVVIWVKLHLPNVIHFSSFIKHLTEHVLRKIHHCTFRVQNFRLLFFTKKIIFIQPNFEFCSFRPLDRWSLLHKTAFHYCTFCASPHVKTGCGTWKILCRSCFIRWIVVCWLDFADIGKA